jgi:hypothetical protein
MDEHSGHSQIRTGAIGAADTKEYKESSKGKK